MITERQKEVLRTIIKEYVKTAQPVSSQLLAEKYGFEICPSMLRIELQNLTKLGFLRQPHTSSGRVPTDRAYRLFVNELLEKGVQEKENDRIKEFMAQRRNKIDAFYDLTRFLSDLSSSFISFHLLKRRVFLQAGLDELLKTPEFMDQEFVFEFLNFIEGIEEKVRGMNIEHQVTIYIGEENPYKVRSLSMICSECDLKDNEKAIISLVGPKRMDYNRNIKIINSLNKVLEEWL